MRHLRAIFLLYLTLLLTWFLPSHTRGQITMTPEGPANTSCCAAEQGHSTGTHTPSERDKANCAVCFWAAGILPEAAMMFDARPIDLALIEAREALDQCASWFIPSPSLPRGPPTVIG